jgi:GntR family transcriptional regulator, transcriptional repressor for pyruvate dehydrogenase complex
METHEGSTMNPLQEQTPPVYQAVQQRLEELIRDGEIRLGEKLPSERALAERFQVSRNSVREAIRGLAEKNVIQSRRGDGTYLRSGVDSASVQPLTQVLKAQGKRLKEIFELRRMLEPHIAGLAARRITRRQIEALKMLVYEQEKRHLYGEDDSELDAAFHLRIAVAARNTLIVEVLKTLDHIIGESRSPALQNQERQKVSMRTHYMIVDALERRDPVSAEQAMNMHLQEIETSIFGREQQ